MSFMPWTDLSKITDGSFKRRIILMLHKEVNWACNLCYHGFLLHKGDFDSANLFAIHFLKIWGGEIDFS